jgi:hypothetical protein
MSEAEIKPVAAPAEKPEDAVAGLQQQIQTLMIALLVCSGVLLVFIWQQMRYAVRDRDLLNQAVQQVVQEKAAIDQFLQRAVDYGKSHPDFVAILNKYQVQQAASNAAPSRVVTPATTPSPAPKK